MSAAGTAADPLVLALETASAVCGVALVTSERTLASTNLDVGRRHSVLLAAEVQRLLEQAGLALDDVTHVAVSIGPGSFTGLRIGLSTAKGICLPSGTPIVPVPTLTALAARLPWARAPVCALLDARKSELYAGLYDTCGRWPRALRPPRAIRAADLLHDMAETAVIFAGPGVHACLAHLRRDGTPHVLAPPDCWRLDAAAVGHAAIAGLAAGALAALVGGEQDRLEPDYLREPDVSPPRAPVAGR